MRSIEKSNDLIGIRTCDLTACSMPEIKGPGLEIDYSPPFRADIKDAWR
jgi:hypothetical protein